MMFRLMLRVFYVLHDSRTLMFIGVPVMVTNITASLLAATGVSAARVVEGLPPRSGWPTRWNDCLVADPQPPRAWP